jgi:hypothetical protein
MKRIMGIFLAFFLVLGFAGSAWSLENLQVSDTATKVKFWNYCGSAYPAMPDKSIPPEWLTDPGLSLTEWINASEYKNSAWFDPVLSSFPSMAKWISFANDGEGPDYIKNTGERGTYVYRKNFKMAATAYNISGEAALGADNYGWLYLNGNKLLGPRNASQEDQNFFAPPSTITDIPTSYLSCNNVIAAEVQNGISYSYNGPTGVIFTLKLNYLLPKVVWQRPVTNSDFDLQYGTTVPLKFKLYTQDDVLINEVRQIKLAVIDHADASVEEWTLGDSVDFLRFEPSDFSYIVNFQTRKYNLADGATYTAKVLDSCSDEELGSVEFTVDFTRGTGKGNKSS